MFMKHSQVTACSDADARTVPIVCIIHGMAIQCGFSTLVATAPQFVRTLSNPKAPLFLAIVTCLFSLVVMADSSLYIPTNFSNARTCTVLYFTEGITYHLLLIVFDVFILIKTYIITRENKIFCALMIIVLLYRAISTVFDMALSGGSWDQETSSCKFTQNGETLFHYAGADLACDALATVGSVVMLISGRFGGVTDLIGQLSLENVTRSILTLVLNLVLMYLAQHPNLSFEVLSVAWAIQNTTLIYLMNMEHVYKGRRQARMQFRDSMTRSLRRESNNSAKQFMHARDSALHEPESASLQMHCDNLKYSNSGNNYRVK